MKICRPTRKGIERQSSVPNFRFKENNDTFDEVNKETEGAQEGYVVLTGDMNKKKKAATNNRDAIIDAVIDAKIEAKSLRFLY